MSESKLRINQDAEGTSIATRLATEQDDENHDRHIQRFDFASGKMPSPVGNAKRGYGTTLNDEDTLDLTNLPSDLTSNLITVGDNSMLCVYPELTADDTNDIDITPIVYDDSGNVITLLETKTFSKDNDFRRGSGSGNYVLPLQTWDVAGAFKIGLHLTTWAGGGGSVNMLIYGWVI